MVSFVTTDFESPKSSYGKVMLALENCILPPYKFNPTPSSLDGLDSESEIDLRILGCELIQTSVSLLRLPQTAAVTAQVLFQRFFYAKSFIRQRMDFVTMACVVLASKIEEAPRRIEAVINVFHHIKQVRCGHVIQPLSLDQNFFNRKKHVIRAERQILKELGFCVHVKHPHKCIVALLEILNVVNNRELSQTAWNYANDGLRSDVYLRYQPETIACACIYLSARIHQIVLPTKPAWFLAFGVSEDEIQSICHTILSLYTRKKPDLEKLMKMVEDLRELREETKQSALASVDNSATVAQDVSPKLTVTECRREKKVENGELKTSRGNSCNKRTCYEVSNASCSEECSTTGSGDSSHHRHRNKVSSRTHKRQRRYESVSPNTKLNYRERSSAENGSPYTSSNSSSHRSDDRYQKRHRYKSPSRGRRRSGSSSPDRKRHRSNSSDTYYKRESHRSLCKRTRSSSRSERHKLSRSNHSSYKNRTKYSHKQNKNPSKNRHDNKSPRESYHYSRHKHRRDRG